MSMISPFVYAAVVFGIAYVVRRMLKTRAWRRALEKQWKKSKLDLISTSLGLVSMLFFFSAILVSRIWNATKPFPLIAFALALVCSGVMLWQDLYSRPSKKAR
jgi:UDP-N-acetylmuramyl pentapeptide phosphotransferase/UDP-N-acetylglucosamine-1-phosphate transferase